MKYLAYLKKLLLHKWFVFLECLKMGMPLVGLIHDWSKFLPDEFIPYARYFGVERRDDDLNRAVLDVGCMQCSASRLVLP